MGPPAAAAALPDDLMEEILLRIPPSDPATLARAAVAQKRWCHLVASPGFRRRYGARHRAAPMLGFICDADGDGFSTFVPAASSSFRPKPRADRRHLRPEDARHGRVLLRGHYANGRILIRVGHRLPFRLVVWNPITRHRVALPRPKGFCDEWDWRATVLCAADPAGSCDHIDCHRRGHFIVVLIGRDNERGDIGLVFMKAENSGILSVDIKSAQVKVVDKRSCISWIVPYINFCFSTPAMGVPSKDDKPRASASRDVQSCVANSLLRQGK